LATKSWHYSRDFFLQDVINSIGSPVFLALCGLIAFYGYAWLRGVRRGELGFIAASLFTLFVGPTSLRPSATVQQLWPLVGLGLVELSVGLLSRQSVRSLIGVTSLMLGGTSLLVGTKLAYLMVPIAHHGALLALILITTLFQDPWALGLRKLAAVSLGITCLVAVLGERHAGITTPCLAAYVLALISLAFALGVLLREWPYFIAGGSSVVACVALAAWQFALLLLRIDGAIPLFAAGICFVMAVLISVLKAGLAHGMEPGATLSNSASASDE
jgi:hypothetical protein